MPVRDLLQGLGGLGLAAAEGLVPEVGAALGAYRDVGAAQEEQAATIRALQSIAPLFRDLGTESGNYLADLAEQDPVAFGGVLSQIKLDDLLDQLGAEREFDQEESASEGLKTLMSNPDFRNSNAQEQFAELVTRMEPADAEKVVQNLQAPGSVNVLDFDDLRQRRNDLERQWSDWREMSSNYFALKNVLTKPVTDDDSQALRDLSAIFIFMKTLDPRSTVREGEVATVENAGAIPERLWKAYNRLLSGDKLSPKQRQTIVSVARDAVIPHAESQQRAEQGEVDFLGALTTPDNRRIVMGGMGLSEQARQEFLTDEPREITDIDEARSFFR